MKTTGFCIMLILFIAKGFSQCPVWIGGSVDSAMALKKIAEKYLEVPLSRTIEKHHKANYDFENTSCNCEFFFITGKQKKPGNKKSITVNEIVINGPLDKIKKLYNEYFYPLMKPCALNVKPESLMIHGVRAGYFSIPLHGQKIGQINLHKETAGNY